MFDRSRKGAARRNGGALCVLAALSLAACATAPPTTYMTIRAKSDSDEARLPYANSDDHVRTAFMSVLQRCSATNPPPDEIDSKNSAPPTPLKTTYKTTKITTTVDGKTTYTETVETDTEPNTPATTPEPTPAPDPTTYAGWAKNNSKSKACVEIVISQALDECIAQTGAQNRVTTAGNIIIGAVMSLAGVANDVSALSKAKSSDSLSEAALATAITTDSAGVQKVFPAALALSIDKIVTSADSYVVISNFNDRGDWNCGSKADGICIDQVKLKCSRLHDAVIASCPALQW